MTKSLLTSFTDEELQQVLDAAEGMTPGVYYVPEPSRQTPPRYVHVAIDDINQPKTNWENVALVLQWGKDVLYDNVTGMDQQAKTNERNRFANAAAVCWAGNNLSMLLKEVLQMREKLRMLGRLEEGVWPCLECDGEEGDEGCFICNGEGFAEPHRIREELMARAKRRKIK